jgi:hypothetical protein
LQTPYKIALVTAIALTFVYAFQGFYPEFISPFSNALFPIVASAAVFSAAFALRKYGPKPNKLLTIWVCFTVGMTLWFLGELTWAVYAFFLNVEIPYPSIADIFWLGGYVPLLIALVIYGRLFSSALSKRKIALIATVIAILGVLVSAALIVPLIGVEENLATFAIDLAYPLLDLALLSMALVGLAIFQKGNLGKSWLWIIIGILLNVAGDMIFSYTTAQRTYYNGHLSELLFIYGYLFFTIAFYVHTEEL